MAEGGQSPDRSITHGCPDGGTDGLAASLTVEVGPLTDRAGFYVADDGTGIRSKDRETVLEHGYSTADGGTGFGLSIVQQIAEKHG